ncbi:MAG TPA: BamA/TamA family outer membrane protein [Longimicrobiales bacterium]|nr:BamA/TamA family outer membrane protein [Longimicrobiales bacterium]
MSRHACSAIPLPLVLLATSLAAQVPPASPCPAGEISYVHIDNKSIFDTADPDLDRRFQWAYNAANRLHIRTREGVIRRELLFGPGSCYDPFLLEETERLLRGYEFLGEVDVFPVPQPDGSFHIIVSTRDEWSTRVDLRFSTSGGFGVEGGRLMEENLLGTGQAVGAFYYERQAARDYGISYFTPQLLGTRWDLRSEIGRTRAGTAVLQEIAYPFVGDVSRWAARQSFRREDQYFGYIAGDSRDLAAPHVLLPVREQTFDLAVVRRVGRRGNMALIGGALSYQQLSYPGAMEVAPEGSFERRRPAPDSLAAPVLPQRHPLDNIRAFALLGHRNVWWVRRQGLDSMRGLEDVRLGAEAVLAVGRSFPAIEVDNDLYAMLGLYSGMELGNALFIGRGRGDARRDLGAGTAAPEWEDMYVEAEILAYLPVTALFRQTLFARAALTAAWHTRTPFQLTIGGVHGVRGYPPERLPGGRRLVLTLEDRIFAGWPLPAVLDMGATVFVDAGRVWAGDAPFGANSGWRAAAGAGLRGSFPAGSRSTYRIDIAWPLERGAGIGDFQLSMSVGERRGIQPRSEDLQLIRSRGQNIGGELFTFRH